MALFSKIYSISSKSSPIGFIDQLKIQNKLEDNFLKGPHNLSQENRQEIVLTLQRFFNDDKVFNDDLLGVIEIILLEPEINKKAALNPITAYFENKITRKNNQNLFYNYRHVLFATFILKLSLLPSCQDKLLFLTKEKFLEEYPEFQDETANELEYLRRYTNYMRLGLQFLPASQKKEALMYVSGRLEGSNNTYVTGGGQSAATKRRVGIYEKEGHIKSVPRTRRKRAEITSAVDILTSLQNDYSKRMKVDEYSSPSEDLSIVSTEEDDEESQESDIVNSENSTNNQKQVDRESVKNNNSNENKVAEPGILVINLIKHLFPGQDVPHVLSQLQEVYQNQEAR